MDDCLLSLTGVFKIFLAFTPPDFSLESGHTVSEDTPIFHIYMPYKRDCFYNSLVLNENQNQRGGSCMTCNRQSVLNSFAESKKKLVTAQLVFLADKKEDKPGQDVVSLHLLSEVTNFVKHNPELLD